MRKLLQFVNPRAFRLKAKCAYIPSAAALLSLPTMPVKFVIDNDLAFWMLKGLPDMYSPAELYEYSVLQLRKNDPTGGEDKQAELNEKGPWGALLGQPQVAQEEYKTQCMAMIAAYCRWQNAQPSDMQYNDMCDAWENVDFRHEPTRKKWYRTDHEESVPSPYILQKPRYLPWGPGGKNRYPKVLRERRAIPLPSLPPPLLQTLKSSP